MGGGFGFYFISVNQNYMQFPERCNHSQKLFGCPEKAIKNWIVQIDKDGISNKTAILGKGSARIILFC